MEDETMENEAPQRSDLIPIALAILAIVLGGAGLYFGLTANQRLTPISESINEGSSSAARIDKQISNLETQLVATGALLKETESSLGRIRSYTNLNEQKLKELASAINEDREQIKMLAEKINELAKQGVQVASSAPTSNPSTANKTADSEVAPPQSNGAVGVYSIQSGDTFAKIASSQGVSLQSLLDANPDADPRRLRIGQEIKIPSN